jgi:hypothetical protein
MSDEVTAGNKALGDIYESFEKKKLGDAKTPVQIIPFFNTNTWTISKLFNGKFKFHSIEDRGGVDIRREYNFTHDDGVAGQQTKTMNIFCLLAKGNLKVPFMISLKNYSFKYAAQAYLDKMALLKAEGKSPAHAVWELCAKTEKTDKGTFSVFTLDLAKDTTGKTVFNTMEVVGEAYKAYKSIKASFDSGAKVDMTDVKETSEDAPF